MKTLKSFINLAIYAVFISASSLAMANEVDLNGDVTTAEPKITLTNKSLPNNEEVAQTQANHQRMDRMERLHKKSGAQLRKEDRELNIRSKRYPHYQNPTIERAEKLRSKGESTALESNDQPVEVEEAVESKIPE